MRLMSAVKSDMKFQIKQGFYTVYIILTIMYMIIIKQLPYNMKNIAIPLVVFTDPSVVGFFFIGGIVMLEKVQGVYKYLAVTPLRAREYLMAKVVSLSILAEAAGLAITAVTNRENVNWPLLGVGILLTSVFFTLYGFVAASNCNSMNQYFIKMVPYMLIIIIPCFSIIGFKFSWLFSVFPSVAGLKLVFGAFNDIMTIEAVINIVYLTVINIYMLSWVEHRYNHSIITGGEVE